MQNEREAIVAFLREKVASFRHHAEHQKKPVGRLAIGYEDAARCIERGDHLKGQTDDR